MFRQQSSAREKVEEALPRRTPAKTADETRLRLAQTAVPAETALAMFTRTARVRRTAVSAALRRQEGRSRELYKPRLDLTFFLSGLDIQDSRLIQDSLSRSFDGSDHLQARRLVPASELDEAAKCIIVGQTYTVS